MNLHASFQEIIGCTLQQNKNLKDHDQEIKEWLIVKKVPWHQFKQPFDVTAMHA